MLLWEREQSKPAKEREQFIYCLKDSYKQFSQLFWTDCMCCLKGHETTFLVILAEVFVLPIIEDISNL